MLFNEFVAFKYLILSIPDEDNPENKSAYELFRNQASNSFRQGSPRMILTTFYMYIGQIFSSVSAYSYISDFQIFRLINWLLLIAASVKKTILGLVNCKHLSVSNEGYTRKIFKISQKQNTFVKFKFSATSHLILHSYK